jgi:hypothetical protein
VLRDIPVLAVAVDADGEIDVAAAVLRRGGPCGVGEVAEFVGRVVDDVRGPLEQLLGLSVV